MKDDHMKMKMRTTTTTTTVKPQRGACIQEFRNKTPFGVAVVAVKGSMREAAVAAFNAKK